MIKANVTQNAKVSAILRKADGTIIDLGVIATSVTVKDKGKKKKGKV